MKKNNETHDEPAIGDDTPVDQTSLLVEKVVEVTAENNILRACNKHIMRLGVVSLELIPVAKMNLSQVFDEFTKFAEAMHKLHGNTHLKATIVHSSEDNEPEMINPEMFG